MARASGSSTQWISTLTHGTSARRHGETIGDYYRIYELGKIVNRCERWKGHVRKGIEEKQALKVT